MVVGFLHDRASRTFAAVQGWLYAPSEALQIAYWQRDLYRYDHTDKKDHGSFKPIPRPWVPVKKKNITDDVRAHVQRHRARVQPTSE